VGNCSALWEVADKDEQVNMVQDNITKTLFCRGTENCFVYGSANSEGTGRLIATLSLITW